MLRNKFIRITTAALLLLLTAWIATPKVYIHNLLHHNHSAVTTTPETKVNTPSGDDCDFDKYDKPVYFNIFKFIFSFLPVKSQDDDKVEKISGKIDVISFAVSLLRAPPVEG